MASQLEHLIRLYGEDPRARSIAKAVERYRQTIGPIKTTTQLASVIESCTTSRPEDRTKTLARVFQAFRIAVNGELDSIECFLAGATALLKEGGRLLTLSYHSLEDRLVKEWLRNGKASGLVQVSPKAIKVSPEELLENTRMKSVRLRVGVRLSTNHNGHIKL